MIGIADLVVADFATQVGSEFTVLGAEGTTMPLMLVEAEPARGAGGFPGRAPFALLFRSGVQEILPHGLHRIEHAEMGILEIGIGPVARTAAGIDYEAVFN